VEQRTRDLAVAAWDVFQQTEAAGGYLAALETGLVAAGCRQTRSRREADLHHRRTPITGVSEYVAPAESPVTRVPAPPPRRPVHRHATPFERLRDRADAAPHRPTVFLALLGPAAAHAPYVAFATGLFATGGVATTAVPVSDDPAATIDAFTTSGARVACIAGTPTDHYTVGERVAKALADAGAVRVWSVGRTGAGDDRLHPGCDAVAALTVTLRDLGVPE
jgi:methylmalonyl-CoA mutase